MRDIKRIDVICDKIKELWKKVPDWRFYQLMINIGLMPDSKLWNIEDDEIIKHLIEQKVIKK